LLVFPRVGVKRKKRFVVVKGICGKKGETGAHFRLILCCCRAAIKDGDQIVRERSATQVQGGRWLVRLGVFF